MTPDLALDYIPRRMEELGYGKNYHLRLKFIMLQPFEKRTIEAYNQLIILIQIGNTMKVESDMGVLDWDTENGTEWQFEHQGKIDMENYASSINYAQYIQVIPKL